MPCETTTAKGQTAAQRAAEVRAVLEELERRITAGGVRVVIGTHGGIAFDGWGPERRGVTDACAFRTLSELDSWSLKQAVAAAEATAGRRVELAAVTGGVHSHDGGRSWHPGH